jgi:hypothetical protein
MAIERPDIETLIAEHNAELEKPVENRQITRLQRLVNAFHKVQETPSELGDASYFYLSSYHGYSSSKVFKAQRSNVPVQFQKSIFCPHGLPEFPAWHRAYILLFERALKAHDPTVMLPFWNESSVSSRQFGYPSLFSEPQFKNVDGTTTKNPLYSYKTIEVIDTLRVLPQTQTGETFRRSGSLVGYLSSYIVGDLKTALKLTDYEDFASGDYGLTVPHDAVHGYTGGWMASVPTAAFDPIFWFHHCFVDYMYWEWQVLHNQTKIIDYSNKHSQLVPFINSSTGKYYTIQDYANIENFGYTYPPFNVKNLGQESRANRISLFSSLGRAKVHKSEGSKKSLRISAIRFADFGGSFIVEVTARVPSGEIPLGVKSVFRFAEGCDNCDLNPFTDVSFRLKDIPQSEEERIQFKVRILMSDNNVLEFTEDLEVGLRTIHRVFGTSLQLEF